MSNLLVVDDDSSVRMLLRKLLVLAGHSVEMAADGREALAAIAVKEPDLILLDLEMPTMTGIEVCHAVKGNPFTSRIPILMLTAQSDIDHKVRGFEAGADDYLGKPFEPRELEARVSSLLRLVRREGDRNPSSGLPGGRVIQAEMERRAAQGAFAICYFDLDNFKPFADTYGFSVADTVIRETGLALRKAVEGCGNTSDFVGHIGGDDFIVVTEQECAEAIAHEASRQFNAIIKPLVGENIADAGSFTGMDRDGHAREFPLVQLSAAVLMVDPATWVSANHLGAHAAEIKRQAKQRGPGTILVQNAI